MTTTADELATTYFSAWRAQDLDALEQVLDDDVDFAGPMGSVRGTQAALAGLRGVRGMVDDILVVRRWSDGPDVITWFEFHRAGHDPVPVVNWSHAPAGRITRIRVTFDPRSLLG